MPVTLRLATLDDVPAIAALFRRVRQAKLPYLPDLHTPADDLAFFGSHVMANCTVWVAETRQIVAFIAFRNGWVDHLYVDVASHGQGIGSALLAKAMQAWPRLQLWAFQKNREAIGFYERKGFRLIEKTEGEDNEEKEADALFVWVR